MSLSLASTSRPLRPSANPSSPVPIRSGFAVPASHSAFLLNRAQPHIPPPDLHLCAVACTCVRKNEEFPKWCTNCTQPHIATHSEFRFPDLSRPIQTYPDHKNVKTLFPIRDVLRPGGARPPRAQFDAPRVDSNPDKSGRKGGRGSKWTLDNQRLTQTLRTPSSGFAFRKPPSSRHFNVH